MRWLAVVFLVGTLGACGDDANGNSDPLRDKARAFVTYNIGLATGYVDYATQRRPQLVELLAALDADVVCLQEVWTEDDVAAVTAGVAATFPYSYSVALKDTTVGPAACTTVESDPLLACVDEKCAGVAAGEIAGCVLDNCRPQFDALSDDCTNCVVANIGKEVDEILNLCKTGSARFTYEGANGLLVLSRAEITRSSHEELESTNTQRSILGVEVELPELGTVAVACTHLAADLTSSGLAYTGPYESWAAENRVQGESLTAFAATFGAGADLTVIMGDMNSGPAVGEAVVAQIPEASWEVLSPGRSAFPSSLVGAGGEVCTYCADNLLNADTISSVMIDHIFLGALPAGFTPSVTRVGTEPISVDSGGEAVSTHPSDHFGVRLLLAPAGSK